MTTFERRQRILDLLREQPGIRVPDLAKRLNVSEGTIRNDLTALAQAGALERVHGGAVVTDNREPRISAFTTRAYVNVSAKQCMARRAATLVSDGDSLLFDASTTVYSIAQFLQDRHNLTVITNGIEVARALAQDLSNTVILLGGVLHPDGISVRGSLSESILKDLHVKTAFVSCFGFTPEAGLTEVDLQEAQLKNKMIAAADSVIALIDATKFGKVTLIPFARTDQVSRFYADSDLAPQWINQLKQFGVALTLCGAERANDALD